MGRAPCCDKVGLKKGPWTPEEDQILINFIHHHGHSNWRALPKQAGLLRCGKSCRLRWINYLRPDIKRGNFTKEEEDTIIQLHEMMGNRWSAIAARLPGRTDNEIKNVWHTHLKKKLKQYEPTKSRGKKATPKHSHVTKETISNSTSSNNFPESSSGTSDQVPTSSYTSEDFSSVTEVSSVEVPNNAASVDNNDQILDSQQYGVDYFPIIDETFWTSEDLLSNGNDMMSCAFDELIDNNQLEFQVPEDNTSGACNNFPSLYDENVVESYGNSMDFWFDVFVKAGGAPELPQF